MKKEEDFVMGLSIYMVCLREKKRYSTAKSYQDALNSFKCFCGMEAIPYAYINRNRLLCYQSWLLDKGRSLNTVSTYMRRIRHIYNLAVEANEAPFVPNLFKDVFTGVESKRKKALPREMLERMFNAPLGDPSLRRVQLTVRLMFAFSGIAFVDLAHLKWENIRDGILQYHRQKSGSLIQLEIPSGALRLLDELSACTAKESFYLFPFLSGRRTGEAAYKEYNRTLSRFNRDLKLLARSTGVTLPVTSYTIRHSFASFLKEQDVSIEVISELLGHKSIKTTQIYLKSFSLERLSKVNRNCFESVCKPIPKVGEEACYLGSSVFFHGANVIKNNKTQANIRLYLCSVLYVPTLILLISSFLFLGYGHNDRDGMISYFLYHPVTSQKLHLHSRRDEACPVSTTVW